MRKPRSKKLNWDMVNRIRELVKTKTQAEVAALFGVSRTTIQCIVENRTWVKKPSEVAKPSEGDERG